MGAENIAKLPLGEGQKVLVEAEVVFTDGADDTLLVEFVPATDTRKGVNAVVPRPIVHAAEQSEDATPLDVKATILAAWEQRSGDSLSTLAEIAAHAIARRGTQQALQQSFDDTSLRLEAEQWLTQRTIGTKQKTHCEGCGDTVVAAYIAGAGRNKQAQDDTQRIAEYVERFAENYPEDVFPPEGNGHGRSPDAVAALVLRRMLPIVAKDIREGRWREEH